MKFVEKFEIFILQKLFNLKSKKKKRNHHLLLSDVGLPLCFHAKGDTTLRQGIFGRRKDGLANGVQHHLKVEHLIFYNC